PVADVFGADLKAVGQSGAEQVLGDGPGREAPGWRSSAVVERCELFELGRELILGVLPEDICQPIGRFVDHPIHRALCAWPGDSRASAPARGATTLPMSVRSGARIGVLLRAARVHRAATPRSRGKPRLSSDVLPKSQATAQ